MKALRENGFPVPEPIAQNRHTIVMSLIDAFPLRQIAKVGNPATLYAELMAMIVELARYGLIHGDFNEFNILIKEETIGNGKGKAPENAEPSDDDIRLVPILIDFPQMVSVDHVNAEMYFDRDVNCIKRYFKRRYGFTSDDPGPFFADAKKQLRKNPGKRLDVEVEASGFSRKMARELEKYMKEVGVDGDGDAGSGTRSDLEDDNVTDEYDEDESDDGEEEQEEREEREQQEGDEVLAGEVADNASDNKTETVDSEIESSSQRISDLKVSDSG